MNANIISPLRSRGFTLLELMVTILIVSILASFAVTSYREYQKRASYSAAEVEMLKLAEQLTRYRARNFNYKGFNPAYLYGTTSAVTTVTLPVSATGTSITYTLTLVDTSEAIVKPLTEGTLAAGTPSALGLGQQWAILATRNDINSLQSTSYNLLLTSTGVRCKTKMAASSVSSLTSYQGCGNASEAW